MKEMMIYIFPPSDNDDGGFVGREREIKKENETTGKIEEENVRKLFPVWLHQPAAASMQAISCGLEEKFRKACFCSNNFH
jgi:hypothetical protein